MIQTPHPPDPLTYQAFAEAFAATGSSLRISSVARAGAVTETRELHIETEPQSKPLKRLLGSVSFRIVETREEDPPVDKNGNRIVGGVNTFPERHVLLLVSPETMAMLNQRLSASGLLIWVCPAVSLSEWDQADAVPIYEARFEVRR